MLYEIATKEKYKDLEISCKIIRTELLPSLEYGFIGNKLKKRGAVYLDAIINRILIGRLNISLSGIEFLGDTFFALLRFCVHRLRYTELPRDKAKMLRL